MYYHTLSPNKKISLSRSMHVWIQRFFNSYYLNVRNAKKLDDLTDEIYFFWFRNCAESEYLWCERLNNKVLEDEFHQELKEKLKPMICTYLSAKAA